MIQIGGVYTTHAFAEVSRYQKWEVYRDTLGADVALLSIMPKRSIAIAVISNHSKFARDLKSQSALQNRSRIASKSVEKYR